MGRDVSSTVPHFIVKNHLIIFNPEFITINLRSDLNGQYMQYSLTRAGNGAFGWAYSGTGPGGVRIFAKTRRTDMQPVDTWNDEVLITYHVSRGIRSFGVSQAPFPCRSASLSIMAGISVVL